jgi:hypothetical protein
VRRVGGHTRHQTITYFQNIGVASPCTGRIKRDFYILEMSTHKLETAGNKLISHMNSVER